jgi:iron complex outermembrane receptor protein
MNKHSYSKLFLSLCAAGLVAQANAEQLVLEEVIVTAQKRAESMQDAPIAISAFNNESIQELGAFNAVDLGEYIPNVSIAQTFGSSNNIRVNIRGIGSGEPSLTIDPKVGIYVDGVYIARNAGAVFDIVDLEMIEVLRGPQGTLWGKNTTGGAVNIRTKKPKGELGFNQLLSFGNVG